MLTLILVLLPLFAGLILFLMRGLSLNAAKNFALVATLLELALGLYAFGFFYGANANEKLAAGGAIAEAKYQWIPALNIYFHLGLDGISMIMVLLTVFLLPVIVLSTFSFRNKNHVAFYALILLAEAALIGVFTAKDAFLFYFFFEAALIPVYFLATLWGGENAGRITFKMFVYTIFGSLFMLVAFVFLYSQNGGSSNIASFYDLELSPQVQGLIFWAFFVAFAIKMPVFPFHSWQPDAYSESPTAATMLLSGIMSKMGVYGLIRILLPIVPFAVTQYGKYALILSIIGLLYGSIIAITQNNMKRLVAYSSFAHIGLMAAGVFTNTLEGLQGAMIQMLAHGINAVGLFFIVKIIFDRTGTRNLDALGGITQKARNLTIAFIIIMLGSVALPLTNGFAGEFLLLKSVYSANTYLGVFAGFTIIFGAVYMLRMVQKSMFGETNEVTALFKDISGTEILTLLPLVIMVIVMGVCPNIFLKITESAIQHLLEVSK